MTSILIIEDEIRISSFLQRGLKAEGYTSTVSADGGEGLEYAKSGAFDLVVLDIGLPTMDGFEVLGKIREHDMTLPVIILTARDSTRDTVAGLEGGANDYMAKPFPFDELLARVRLRLRESERAGTGQYRHEGIVLDTNTRKLTVDGRDIELSAREFTLAAEFLQHPGHVLSREQLLSRVWGFDFDPGSNVVDVYVRYLRNKIGRDAIETVRGMGYRLR